MSSSSLGVFTSLVKQLLLQSDLKCHLLAVQTKGKRGSTAISVFRKKLYKSSILKAKETLQIKMIETGLANKIEEKIRGMAESLMATKRDVAETKAKSRLLKMRRKELMDELIDGINDFVRLREMETLLMLELGFL
ncbi:hypothetical protein REPUB_Repub06bG0057200 [Reevesia pubescens]